MLRRSLVLLSATLLVAGCRAMNEEGVETSAAGAATLQPDEPPAIDAGLSVDQAYAAIPHRRTVWDESSSTVPPAERPYLRVIFKVIDEAVAVRVAGLQDFSAGEYDRSDPVAQYDQLIGFARRMPVPRMLAAYHRKVLDGLSGQRQFFADWKSQRAQFPFARQIAGHSGVRRASAALRAAYNELMGKYPDESSTNKDAFFDYHCALDFL